MSIEVIAIIIVALFIITAGMVVYQIITSAVREAVSNAKPTIINNGTYHNHNYYNGQEEAPNLLKNETISLLLEGVVETAKAINANKSVRKTRKQKQSRR